MTNKRLLKASKWMLFASSSALGANLAVLFYGVLTRYILNGAPIWTDELARFLIIGSVLLALSNVYLTDQHMRVSIIKRYLSKNLHTCLLYYRWFVILTITLIFAYGSFQYAQSLVIFKTPGLGISKVFPLMILPTGFASLFLCALFKGPITEEQDQC